MKRWLWIPVLLLALAACAGAHDEPAAPAAPATSRSSGSAALPEPAPTASPAKANADGVIQCGSDRCTLGKQLCCIIKLGAELITYCADFAPPSPTAPGDTPLDRAIRDDMACQAAAPGPAKSAPEGVSRAQLRCDDSSDCGAGERCCIEWRAADIQRGFCEPLGSASSCTEVELCRAKSCRSAGTTCCPPGACNQSTSFVGHVVGLCAPSAPHVPCGSAPCTAEAPICCWEPGHATCKTADQCQLSQGTGAPWQCTRSEHCGSMTCCITLDGNAGSACRLSCDSQVQSAACVGDEDCPVESGRRLRCKPVGRGPAGVKRCQPG